MENRLRLFIALELSEQIHQNLADLISDLKKGFGSEIKWVDPQQVHLTLKFIGEVPSASVHPIKQVLDEVTQENPSFVIEASGTGVFPNTSRPRVLWVGLSHPSELPQLQIKIEEALIPLKIPKENRPFSAHLTFGRVNDSTNAETVKSIVKQLMANSQKSFGSVKIEKVTLFQSTLTPKGPIYTPLARFPLKKYDETMLK
jgi:2'-5' RNA ligase